MIPIWATITSREVVEFDDYIRHPGQEFVLVLAGKVRIQFENGDSVVLGKLESAYFDSGIGHVYLTLSKQPAEVLAVCSDVEEIPTRKRPPRLPLVSCLERHPGTQPRDGSDQSRLLLRFQHGPDRLACGASSILRSSRRVTHCQVPGAVSCFMRRTACRRTLRPAPWLHDQSQSALPRPPATKLKSPMEPGISARSPARAGVAPLRWMFSLLAQHHVVRHVDHQAGAQAADGGLHFLPDHLAQHHAVGPGVSGRRAHGGQVLVRQFAGQPVELAVRMLQALGPGGARAVHPAAADVKTHVARAGVDHHDHPRLTSPAA